MLQVSIFLHYEVINSSEIKDTVILISPLPNIGERKDCTDLHSAECFWHFLNTSFFWEPLDLLLIASQLSLLLYKH